MAALGSEGARWKESIISLNSNLTILVGDVLLASAFVSYIGCFNKRFRQGTDGQDFPAVSSRRGQVCTRRRAMSASTTR